MRRADAGVLVVSLVLLATCEQAPNPLQPPLHLVPSPVASVSADPTSETITLTVSDTAFGTASGTTNQATSQYVRIFKITGTASIAVSKRFPEATNPWPNPLTASNNLGVRTGGSVNAQYGFDATNPDTRYITLHNGETIWQAYAGGGTQNNQGGLRADGSRWDCGPAVYNYCYSYSGGGSVTITPLEGDIHLTVDSSNVSIGSSVKFKITGDTVEGWPLPIQIDTVQWIPAKTANGGEASEGGGNACTFSGAPLQCPRQVLGSATLRVVAHVSGFRRVATQDVTVREGHIVLTASKSAVQKGDSVSFTASWSDGTPIQIDRWTFVPDSGSDITFGCPAYQNPCKRPIQQSGSMKVTAVRNNKLRTATAHVNVITCLTGDNALDDKDVRAGFASIMRLSNPDSAPGSGIDSTDYIHTGNRKERGLWIIRRENGDYYTLPMNNIGSTECSFAVDWPQYETLRGALPPGDTIVAIGHTHPSQPGEQPYGNCKAFDPIAGDTVRAPRWVGDTASHGPTSVGPDYPNGGGSDNDWKIASTGIDVYTMNRTLQPFDATDPGAEGEIFKLPAGWDPDTQRMQDLDTRRKTWGAICGWK